MFFETLINIGVMPDLMIMSGKYYDNYSSLIYVSFVVDRKFYRFNNISKVSLCFAFCYCSHDSS